MTMKHTGVAISSALLFGALAAAFGTAQTAHAGSPFTNPVIYPDCVNNVSPLVCTAVVAEIKAELALFNKSFNPPDVDAISKFYHPQVVQYVSSIGVWFVGRNNLKTEFFVPFAASITGASLDFSPYHYQVIGVDMVVTYGAIPGVIHLKDGTTVAQNPLPQTVTWVRNPDFDLQRPFVVLSDHE